MIVPLQPPLEGVTAERFLALAQALSRASKRNSADLQTLLEDELIWLRTYTGNENQAMAYEASARVLLDLVRLGWQIREHGYGIELVSETPRLSGFSPDEILAEKQKTRDFFKATVHHQLNDPYVRAFIERMENPSSKSGKKPITLLIADGSELHARLLAARQSDNADENPFAEAISPYLQLATTDAIDETTGHSLRDIWRYFRYSWSIPQFSTPGRQLLYLVRDATHPCHPIMGIIGLNNCALQMGEVREDHLGWSLKALQERLNAASASPESLNQEYTWLESLITTALDDVDPTHLVSPEELAQPSRENVARLRRHSQEFDRLRDETLIELARIRTDNDGPMLLAETEELDEDHPPVDDEMLLLEGKSASNTGMQKARKHLVARKRAALLAELLHARLMLLENRDALLNPSLVRETIKQEEIGVALQTVLAALKSRYAGINMLEISTCGAIPPYNHLLGGKLAALLLFSPQIPSDYRRLYSRPSIISSQLKNAHIQRDSTLVYLGTTSLYAHGSSQYERIRLPAGIISKQQPELRYHRVGLSSGYGTLQFLSDTRIAVENYLREQFKFRDVNSIFGEGPSPKLRRLVSGLRELGFPPATLMVHNRQRLIYAAELTDQAREFLNARPANLPDYLSRPDEFLTATDRIVAFWRCRWLASRLSHVPSMNSLLTANQWRLSDRLQSMSSAQDFHKVEEPMSFSVEPSMQGQLGKNPSFDFWKKIAASGIYVTSDSLSEKDFSYIHIETPLEKFIAKEVRNGTSIFLTGNAGDGKTHILRRLAPTIRDCGAVVVEDATAVMRKGSILPILDQWREAVSKKVPFCIAINEYPLYLLLRDRSQPVISELIVELNRQCQNRLVYGSESKNEESNNKLLLIDLSFRNPLNPDIASNMLDKLLSDVNFDKTFSDSVPMLARNINRLQDKQVRERILFLFERLSDMGCRTTIRELWIILASMLLGYRSDLEPAFSDGFKHWYSEILFSNSQRFTLSRNLSLTDPATCSHPVWDSLIENPEEMTATDWHFGLPRPSVAVQLDRHSFSALKRAFYFEHNNGMECFDLEDADAADFRKLLRQHRDDNPSAKRKLIEAINRAYCPIRFTGCNDNLYLWIGHRFHEQPSKVFLANQHIPETELRLLKPRIPKRISQALHSG